MSTEIGKQRVVGWVLGKYCAKDLRYVLLDGHDAEVIRHDNIVRELNDQLEAQAAYSSMQFDRIAELTDEVARYKTEAEYMQWIADNAEVVTTGQGMRLVLALNVFGNNNWSLRDYLSMEINGTMHGIARNALKEPKT